MRVIQNLGKWKGILTTWNVKLLPQECPLHHPFEYCHLYMQIWTPRSTKYCHLYMQIGTPNTLLRKLSRYVLITDCWTFSKNKFQDMFDNSCEYLPQPFLMATNLGIVRSIADNNERMHWKLQGIIGNGNNKGINAPSWNKTEHKGCHVIFSDNNYLHLLQILQKHGCHFCDIRKRIVCCCKLLLGFIKQISSRVEPLSSP
jgi:hypothetical protein